MTQDEIIEMARQAGFEIDCCSLEWHKRITAFAKLVAEKERKDCSELCMDLHTLTDGAHNFYQFAANQILKMGQA
jgi:hypothetical protein